MRVLGVIFFAVLVLVGCGTDKQTMQLIGEAESVMIEYPDSALNIMRSIDPASIRGDEDMAHYRLAMAEAMYHNYVDDGRDSLTTLFYDYYLKSDDHEKRARALYQHAFAMHSVGKVPDAVCALHEAEKSLSHVDNYRLLGLVHREKGNIYSAQCLYNDALASYELAEKCFDRANLQSHRTYARRSVGVMYSKMKMYDTAVENLMIAQQMSEDINDTYINYIVKLELCYIYLQLKKYVHADKIIDSISLNTIDNYGKCDYYCALSIISAFKGDYALSKEYLSLAEQDTAILSHVHIYYARYMLYEFMGDYDAALAEYNNLKNIQDDYVYSLITDSPLHYNIELLKHEISLKNEIHSKNELIYILIIAIIIVIVLYLCDYAYNVSRRKSLYIATLLTQVESVQNELYIKREKIKSLLAIAEEKRSAVAKMQHQLNTNICRGLQNINSLLDAYYIDNTKSLKQREIIAAIDSYVANFAESPEGYYAVEQFVNQYRDNIMELLRIELPMLKESDYRLLCLVYADFSSNAICMFMNCDKNKLYKQKSKLKSIISQSNSEHKQVFLKYL